MTEPSPVLDVGLIGADQGFAFTLLQPARKTGEIAAVALEARPRKAVFEPQRVAELVYER